MRKIVINTNARSCQQILLMIVLCYGSVFVYLNAIFTRIPFIGSYIIGLICFFLSVQIISHGFLKSLGIKHLAILLFFGGALLIAYTFIPGNKPYISQRFKEVISPCLPYFILGSCCKFDEETVDKLGKLSCFGIILSFVYLFFYISSGNNMENDMMSWSYGLLPSTMMAINFAFKKKKTVPMLCVFLGMVYALIMGTRGPIIIAFAFVLEAMWIYSKKSLKTKISITILLTIVLLVFFLTPVYKELLSMLMRVIAGRGLSIRILIFLSTGEMIKDSSGRDEYYSILLSKLNEKPLLGYGVYGDYAQLHTAAHNMYLEAVYDFGIIIGALIIALLLISFIRNILTYKNTISLFQWLMMWGMIVFIRGLFGGSLYSQETFFLMGLCANTVISQYTHRIDSSNNDDLIVRYIFQ